MKMEDLKELYREDYVNKFNDSYHIQLKRIENIVDNIEIKPNSIVADFGCGNGLLCDVLIDKVNQYYGIDFSQEFIDLFNERLENKVGKEKVQLYAEDIIEFSKRFPSTFDYAFTLDFSEHIYDEQFIDIYKSIMTTLKPNGKMILHTPNGDYFIEILKNKGIMKQFPEHVAVRNLNEYEKLFNNIGFNQIKNKYLSHYTWLKYFHFLSFLPIVGKYFNARLLISIQK